jgi:hypothetical protein
VKHYRLDGTNVVECGLLEWAEEFKKPDRIIKQINLPTGVRVSTVFLGIDHGFDVDGPPELFETMIFGIEDDSYQTRCNTFEEALVMHEDAIKHCCITLEVTIEEQHDPR